MGHLRFFLAALVVLGHSGPPAGLPTIGALVAVQCFFVISGFYMAATYKMNYGHEPSYQIRFIASRFARLYPLYFATVVATAGFWCMGDQFGWHLNIAQVFNYFTDTDPKPHFAVWSMLGQDIVSTDQSAHVNLPARQAWSLSAEMIFYALTPLVCRCRPRYLLLACVAAFTAKSLILHSWGWRYSYFPFYAESGYFLLGAWIYFVRQWLLINRTFAILSSLGFIAYSVLGSEASFEFGLPSSHVFLIGLLCLAIPNNFEFIKGKVGDFFGDLSYGVYVLHFLLIEALVSMMGAAYPSEPTLRFILILGTSAGLAAAFEFALQRHIDEWRRRVFYRRRSGRLVDSHTSLSPPSDVGAAA